MFKQLQLKLKNSVFIVVTIILCLNLSFIYFVYSSFLKDDFSHKSQQISECITDYTKLQMNLIENDAARFCGENDVLYSLKSPASTIYDCIVQLKLTNESIDSIFAFSYDSEYFYTPLYSDTFKDFIEYTRQHNFSNIRQSEWIAVTNTYIGKNSNFLVYILQIKNADSTPAGAAAFIVDTSKLCYTQNKNNIFLENAYCYIKVPDLTNTFSVNTAPQKNIVLTGSKTQKPYNMYSKNYNSSVDINITISGNQISSGLKRVIYMLASVFLAADVILYLILSKYTSLIARHLTRLTNEINDFKKSGGGITSEKT